MIKVSRNLPYATNNEKVNIVFVALSTSQFNSNIFSCVGHRNVAANIHIHKYILKMNKKRIGKRKDKEDRNRKIFLPLLCVEKMGGPK